MINQESIVPRYMPFGLPATATVTFSEPPQTTAYNIVVNGVTYTNLTHFGGIFPADIAKAFSDAVNGSNHANMGTRTSPIQTVYAIWQGKQVFLVASQPGTFGNNYTLTTTATTGITLSGATFSGGVGSATAGSPYFTFADLMYLFDTVGTTPLPVTVDLGFSQFRTGSLVATVQPIKAGAGNIYGLYACASTAAFIRFYNIASASVTVGTSTTWSTIHVPTTGVVIPASDTPLFQYFDTAISVAATTGIADSDTAAPSANTITLTVLYK